MRLARGLVFLPPAHAAKLMQRLGERPGAEVLGVVIELVGWHEAPAASSYVDELLLAEQPGR